MAHGSTVRFGVSLSIVFDLIFLSAPVAASIITGAIGSHILLSATFITAAHYAVNTRGVYRSYSCTDGLSHTSFSMVLDFALSLCTRVSGLTVSRVRLSPWGASSSQA